MSFRQNQEVAQSKCMNEQSYFLQLIEWNWSPIYYIQSISQKEAAHASIMLLSSWTLPTPSLCLFNPSFLMHKDENVSVVIS